MALRKLRFASSRCSAGELTLGEFGSELWDSPEGKPRVKRDGLIAMFEILVCCGGEEFELRQWMDGGNRNFVNDGFY